MFSEGSLFRGGVDFGGGGSDIGTNDEFSIFSSSGIEDSESDSEFDSDSDSE